MKRVWMAAACVFGSVPAIGAVGQVQAATPTTLAIGIVVGTAYTYGDTTFTFSGCASCDDLKLLGITNGRAGTAIEIERKTPASFILQNHANAADSALSFALTVGSNTGSHGISSVTNTVTGSAISGSTADQGRVQSVLSAITGTGTVGGGSLTSTLAATPAAVTWPNQAASFSLTETLNTNSKNAANTLTLTNVQLLFNPAPEPASIALFATGLIALTAARRRFGRRSNDCAGQ